MKKRALILAMITFIAAATSEPSINMVRAEETQTEENTAQTSELPIKTLTQKVIDDAGGLPIRSRWQAGY